MLTNEGDRDVAVVLGITMAVYNSYVCEMMFDVDKVYLTGPRCYSISNETTRVSTATYTVPLKSWEPSMC
jgi:hypothetical protein